jgi:hypothetical protein
MPHKQRGISFHVAHKVRLPLLFVLVFPLYLYYYLGVHLLNYLWGRLALMYFNTFFLGELSLFVATVAPNKGSPTLVMAHDLRPGRVVAGLRSLV